MMASIYAVVTTRTNQSQFWCTRLKVNWNLCNVSSSNFYFDTIKYSDGGTFRRPFLPKQVGLSGGIFVCVVKLSFTCIKHTKVIGTRCILPIRFNVLQKYLINNDFV